MKSAGPTLPKQAPAVLVLTGDDSIGREKARERIVQQVMEAHPGCIEEHFDPSREPFSAFAERIITPSLFHPMRIFHLRHANELSAKDVAFLADIVAAPPPDATIIVEIDPPQRGSAKADALMQKLGKKKGKAAADPAIVHLSFVKPPEYKLAAWLTEQVPLLFSRDISKANAEHLIDLVGGELDKLYSELLKIDIMLPAGAPVDKEAIEYITGASRVMNAGELAKAVGAKNFVRTLEVIDSLFVASVSLPAVLGVLFRHFWAMFRIRAFAEAQRDTMRQYLDRRTAYEKKNAIAAEIGYAAGCLKKDDPPSKAYPVVILSGIVDQARVFTTPQLKQIIRWLQEFDAAVKSGRLEPGKNNLQLLCYKIIRVAELDSGEEELMRYFFRVEYDGARYGGWQSQHNTPSVQSTVNDAFSRITRQPCVIVGGGRTDAGVHARGQGAHLDVVTSLEPVALQKSVNAVLPQDIAISSLQPVDEQFHARFSAVQRLYKYYIVTRKMPLWHRRAWAIYSPLDWELVKANVPHLLGRHDFSTFCAAGHSTKSMLCTVSQASLTDEKEYLVFTIAANRFLYRMVRSIVGTLVDIGRGKMAAPLSAIIDARDRMAAGTTAPAWGLVLDHISYNEV